MSSCISISSGELFRLIATTSVSACTELARVAVAVLVLGVGQAGAAEIRLLSAAAMQSVLKETTADFERETGHRLIIAYDTIGGIERRLRNGESHDVVIGSSLIMPSLAQEGRLDPNSLVDLCRTAIGAVVPDGTPKPRFASVEDFKQALIGAKFIVYADPARGGAAGIHIARQIEKLGLMDQVKAKTRVAAGGDITEVTLGLGTGALGMTQMSEIVQGSAAGRPAARRFAELHGIRCGHAVTDRGRRQGVHCLHARCAGADGDRSEGDAARQLMRSRIA